MADIEKVIKGLECCLNSNDCKNCPYKEGYDTKLSCIDRSKKDAVELLKEYKSLQPLVDELSGLAHEAAKQFRTK